MTVVLPVPSIPRSFAPGTYNGYARAFNFGVTRFVFTPTAASATYTGGNFHILFSGAHGGIWLVDTHLQKFTAPGDATVFDQALTWLGGTPITVIDDARAKTVTISGALTGNGTFSYTLAGPYHDVTDTLYLGSFTPGPTFDFVGTLSNVDDLTPDMSWSPCIHEMPVRRVASAALLVAALVAPPVLPSAPVPPLSWAPTFPDQIPRARAPLNVGGQCAPEKITLAAAAPAMSWTPQFPDLVPRARSPLNVGGVTGPVTVITNIPAPPLSWTPVFPDLVPRARSPLNVGGMMGPVAIVLTVPVSPLSWAPTFPDIINRARHPLHAAAGAVSPPPSGGRSLTVGDGAVRQNILNQLAFATPLTTFGTDLTFTAVAATDTLTTGTHGMIVTAGPFRLSTTGTLPAGSDSTTLYYMIVPSTTTVKLALSPALAKAGTAVDLTDAGTGTHTLVRTVNTQPLYSTFLAIFARGTQATAPNQATDSFGNTYSYIPSAPRNYDAFPSSSFSVSIARGAGGAGHTWSAAIGNIGGQQDEVVIAGLELFNTPILQSSSVLEVANGTSATITSAAVTTTAKALLVAIVGGNGNVNQGHIFTTPAGYTRIARVCAEGDCDPAGYIQIEVFTRLVDIAGTYKYSTQGTVSGDGPEGAILWHLAFQAVTTDLQPFDWLYRQDEIPRRARRVLEGGETAPPRLPAPAAPLLSWAPAFPDLIGRASRRQPSGETAPALNFAPAPWWSSAPDLIPRSPIRITAGETAPPVVVVAASVPSISSWAPSFPDAAPRALVRLQGGETAPVTTPAPAAVPLVTSWSPSFPHALARTISRQTAGEVAPVAIVPPPVVPAVNSWLAQPVMVPLRARRTAPGEAVGPVLVIPQAPAPPLWAPYFPDFLLRVRTAQQGGEASPFSAALNFTPPLVDLRPIVVARAPRLLTREGRTMQLYLQMLRGESRVITVGVLDPDTGLPVDLTTGKWQVVTLEWQVKLNRGDPDPALVGKSLGAGIVITAGAVTPQVAITVLPADNAGLAANVYSHDLVATFTSGARVYLIEPSGLAMRGVVNQL